MISRIFLTFLITEVPLNMHNIVKTLVLDNIQVSLLSLSVRAAHNILINN